MSAFFNLGVFTLGIIAWIIPIAAIILHRKGFIFINFSIYSFTFCAIALSLQLFEVRNRVNMEDFNALMDTIGVISVVSVILIVITFTLNITASCLCNIRKK